MTPVRPYFEASALRFKLLYDKRGLGFKGLGFKGVLLRGGWR